MPPTLSPKNFGRTIFRLSFIDFGQNVAPCNAGNFAFRKRNKGARYQ